MRREGTLIQRGEERAESHEREEGFGSTFYMVFVPPGHVLCKLGLGRSVVCLT